MCFDKFVESTGTVIIPTTVSTKLCLKFNLRDKGILDYRIS